VRHPRQLEGDGQINVRFATTGEPVAATDDRTFTFVFSDESVDRYGDVIFARGWDLANFNANPIALFGHDAGTVENVIGRAKNVRVEGSRLIGDIEFMGADVNPNAEAVYQMVKGGFLKTVSVGFQPIEWELAKDKSRPQGVNFKKQELLEISIVPIPANANALLLAKAAGIDIARLGLSAEATQVSRDAALKIHKKGLYSVSFLASILCDLGYLQDSVAWEAEYEGDNSPIPQALLDAMKALGQVLIDMTAEEVAELLAGRDDDGAEESEVVALSADDVRLAAIKAIVALPEAAAAGLLKAASSHAKGDKVTISIAKGAPFVVPRAGKAISAANEKCLRAAHDHITAAASAIMSVVEPEDDDSEAEDDDNDEARALRARKAAARARRHAIVG
jgi:HK97 family phage prohead protease